MLIELPSLDLDRVPERLSEDRVLDAVENLTAAHLEGSHLVYAGRPMIRAIQKAPGLSRRAQNGLRDIERRALQGPPVALSVSMQIRFDPATKAGKVADSPLRYELPITALATSTNLQPTRLLAEAVNDLKFLEIVIDEWRKQCRPNGDPVRFSRRPAGGGSLVHLFELEVQAALPPMLVVADSDRGNQNSRTAHDVQKAHERGAPSLRHLKILSGHEIENYLPATLLHEAYPDAPDVRAKIQAAGADVGAAGPEDLKAMIAANMLDKVLEWLKERGASPNLRRTALPLRSPSPLSTLAEECYGWGIAREPARV